MTQETSAGSSGVRWLVMQSLTHRKWVLSVVRGTFEEYQVTDLMSENVDMIIQYADYLNHGRKGAALDNKSIDRLERMRDRYCGQPPAGSARLYSEPH